MSDINRHIRSLMKIRPRLGLLRASAIVQSILPLLVSQAGVDGPGDSEVLERLLAAADDVSPPSPYLSPFKTADLDKAQASLDKMEFKKAHINEPPATPPGGDEAYGDLVEAHKKKMLDDAEATFWQTPGSHVAGIDLGNKDDKTVRRVIEVAPPAQVTPPRGEGVARKRP